MITNRKIVQNRINKAISNMIKSGMIDNDIVIEMQEIKATLKIKPRVVISTGRIPIGVKQWSERDHVTIYCALAYKTILSQVLVQMADPGSFHKPIISSPLEI